MIATFQVGQIGRDGATTTVTGALDLYTTSLWAAYGITRQIGPYAGPAIRVRKSTGADTTTELDIGLSGVGLDTPALATFGGSETVVVTKLYDQSGSGRDLSTATTSKQPRIVNAGTFDGFLVFDGTDDELLTTATSGTPSAFSVSAKIKYRGGNTPTQTYWACGTGAGGNSIVTHFLPTGVNQLDVYVSNSAGSLGDRTFNPQTTPIGPTVAGCVWQLSAGSAALAGRLWRAGVEQTGGGGAFPTGSTTAQTWRLGSQGGGTPAKMDLYSFAIWEANLNASMAAIATAMA